MNVNWVVSSHRVHCDKTMKSVALSRDKNFEAYLMVNEFPVRLDDMLSKDNEGGVVSISLLC